MKRELRFIRDAGIEIRGEDKQPVIRGYAAVFNSETQIGSKSWGFREVIMPGAFSRAIKEKQDVRGLVDHNAEKVLGRTKSGTLRLTEDSKGLLYDIDPPNTSYANDLQESIRRGDIDQSSFGFVPTKTVWRDETDKDGDTIQIREIHDCDLFDVSPVTYPAYESTSVSVRSMFPDGQIDIPAIRTQEKPADESVEFRERMTLRLNLAEKI